MNKTNSVCWDHNLTSFKRMWLTTISFNIWRMKFRSWFFIFNLWTQPCNISYTHIFGEVLCSHWEVDAGGCDSIWHQRIGDLRCVANHTWKFCTEFTTKSLDRVSILRHDGDKYHVQVFQILWQDILEAYTIRLCYSHPPIIHDNQV